MGDTGDPPWVYASAAASDAAQSARLAGNQMERLLTLLETEKVLTHEHAQWVRNAPR
jgi:hypothetical protein